MAIITLSVAMTVVLAACGEPDPVADPRFEAGDQPSGRILYVRNNDVHMWDGSDSQITDFGDTASPAWAPDGQRFSFIRMGDAHSDLYLGNLGSSNYMAVTDNEPPFTPGTSEYLNQVMWILDPTWSDSSGAMIYVSDRGTAKNYLWYQSSASAEPEPIYSVQNAEDNVEKPDMSPSGTDVVYSQREQGEGFVTRWTELRVANLSSGEVRSLVTADDTDHQSAYYPRWSPDGDWVVYVRQSGESTDLWAVSEDGEQHVRLTEKGNVTAPVWSPDGQFIAFFETSGSGFKASYIEVELDGDEISADDPQELFTGSGIDAPSGMSWSE